MSTEPRSDSTTHALYHLDNERNPAMITFQKTPAYYDGSHDTARAFICVLLTCCVVFIMLLIGALIVTIAARGAKQDWAHKMKRWLHRGEQQPQDDTVPRLEDIELQSGIAKPAGAVVRDSDRGSMVGERIWREHTTMQASPRSSTDDLFDRKPELPRYVV
ncbi:hypothetical protein FZEAL_7344 [Fusarium zealandicum]|uniref:Uncharacterized protein n=1 Tax=Fusarium zealandicum TaxID=1053134 RepID=A0A8H4UG94_9HYPO|nr:hypothetical protein FZEAL_7344 [Fusarium zealandicum]